MGKRLITQRRGRGTHTYKAPSHRYVGATSYRTYDEIEKSGIIMGKVVDIINCPGHSTPLVEIEYQGGDRILTLATLGIHTNQEVSSGANAQPVEGNTVPLKIVQIGTNVSNIESQVGDGGKFMKASGTSAKVIAKKGKKVTIQFKSKKTKILNEACRATIGIMAGGGRQEKPILKAGKRMHMMRAKNKLYPQTSGVAMNAVDHPFGSGRGRHMGKPRTVSRNAPSGRKVGSIASKRTGKKK
ncbi:50S ribosomal protein L2 [archaeon]|nr:50S ribosomal protein L2 [archaeon]